MDNILFCKNSCPTLIFGLFAGCSTDNYPAIGEGLNIPVRAAFIYRGFIASNGNGPDLTPIHEY